MTETEKIIDKLNFYIGFLDTFCKDGINTLRENDWHRLKMTREYMIDAINKIRDLIKKVKKL